MCLLVVGLGTSPALAGQPGETVSGVVKDASGATLAGADVTLMTAQRSPQNAARTDAQGRFKFEGVAQGRYLLVARAAGFSEQVQSVEVGAVPQPLEIRLGIEPIRAQITVTAETGQVLDRLQTAQAVNSITPEKVDMRAKSVVAQAAQEEPGLALQRTSPTMSGVFVRGLTGAKVSTFVDGVRYSTGAARGGVNTFLNLIEPTSLEAIEVLRGPNSAQYGSDSIGGTVQFLTFAPRLADTPEFHATLGSGFNSADMGFGSNAVLSLSTRKLSFVSNLAARRVNTLRSGGGIDSHSALTRFLGVSSRLLYDRNPGTAFTQYGGVFKLNWMPLAGTSFTASYMRGQQDGGRRHDQLLGGDGNLIADLRNLMNDFLYVRLDQSRLGWLDHLALTYSYNVQREERVNQGGQGSPTAAVTHEPERMRVHGVQFHAGKEFGSRFSALLGGDFFSERIFAPSFQQDPVSLAISVRRGRVPDNSRYKNGGLFLQSAWNVVPQRLRLTGSVRWSAAGYKSRAADSPLVGGNPLWPDDSLRVGEWTGRAGAVFSPVQGLSLILNISRGFRAPHITDLATIGLTGSGFEAAAPDLAGRGATIGDSAGVSAVNTGIPVRQVRPETSWLSEGGVRYRTQHFETEATFFLNNFKSTIEKFALILPPGAVGQSIGGQVITSQNANGVVFVAASASPVLIRANLGDAKIYGFEHDMEWRFAPSFAVRTVITWLHARDPRTGLPPNIEGGTPAPDFWLKVRYAPGKQPFWVEPYLHGAMRQSALSSLDLSDRRIGADRTRGQIQNFFRRGATVRGLVSPGPDTIFGNADDVLIATGETLAQVQDRVLGVGVNNKPLFTAVPGYFTLGLRGGWHIRENHVVTLDFENINDRNYRGISWGIDAPGRSLTLRYTARF